MGSIMRTAYDFRCVAELSVPASGFRNPDFCKADVNLWRSDSIYGTSIRNHLQKLLDWLSILLDQWLDCKTVCAPRTMLSRGVMMVDVKIFRENRSGQANQEIIGDCVGVTM